MKKYRRFITTILAVVCLFVYAIPVRATKISYGDANGDGVTNIQDVVRLKRYLAEEKTFVDKIAADSDENDILDDTDLDTLRGSLVGKEEYQLDITQGNIEWSENWK